MARGDDAPKANVATVLNASQRWALLAAFTLIVMLRLPGAWAEGRFLDEEATVFLAYAWHHPWDNALFRSFAGYLNIGANATTLLVARLVQGGIVPLERAPYLTMLMALAVQMLPAFLILTGKAEWLSKRVAVVAALLMMAIMPATEEVFFNVLHIQFHLALCVGLILALDVPQSRLANVGYGLILFLAPLCGPAAIVLLPLFALRVVVDRDPARLWQFAPLVAGAAVQLLLFYGSSPVRGNLFDPGTLGAALFVRLVALPLLGIDWGNILGSAILGTKIGGPGWWWFAASASAIVFGSLLFVASRRRDAAVWLVLSALMLAGVSLGFGMVSGEHNRTASLLRVVEGERYNFLPLVLLGIALIVLAAREGFEAGRVFAVLCGFVLLTGAYCYFRPLSIYAKGPSWSAEVASWRADRDYPLAVWPRPFRADLSDTARRCSKPDRAHPRPEEPRYCESSWLSSFYGAKPIGPRP